MAFRKPIFTEPFNLFEASFRKFSVIPVSGHSLNEFIPERINGSHLSKCCHGPA